MKMLSKLLATLFAMAAVTASAATGEPLVKTIADLDAAAFDAFNHCSAPEQLEKHAGFLHQTWSFITTQVGLPGRART